MLELLSESLLGQLLSAPKVDTKDLITSIYTTNATERKNRVVVFVATNSKEVK